MLSETALSSGPALRHHDFRAAFPSMLPLLGLPPFFVAGWRRVSWCLRCDATIQGSSLSLCIQPPFQYPLPTACDTPSIARSSQPFLLRALNHLLLACTHNVHIGDRGSAGAQCYHVDRAWFSGSWVSRDARTTGRRCCSRAPLESRRCGLAVCPCPSGWCHRLHHVIGEGGPRQCLSRRGAFSAGDVASGPGPRHRSSGSGHGCGRKRVAARRRRHPAASTPG